jgi:hypothetical protein
MDIFQDVDQPFGFDLGTATPQRIDENVRRNEAFQRHVVRVLTGEILCEGVLVVENRARIAGYRAGTVCVTMAPCVNRGPSSISSSESELAPTYDMFE